MKPADQRRANIAYRLGAGTTRRLSHEQGREAAELFRGLPSPLRRPPVYAFERGFVERWAELNTET